MTRISATNPNFQVDADSIGWITFDDPERKLNVLSEPVMRDLAEALDQAHTAEREGLIQALVIQSSKPSSFIAGAENSTRSSNLRGAGKAVGSHRRCNPRDLSWRGHRNCVGVPVPCPLRLKNHESRTTRGQAWDLARIRRYDPLAAAGRPPSITRTFDHWKTDRLAEGPTDRLRPRGFP